MEWFWQIEARNPPDDGKILKPRTRNNAQKLDIESYHATEGQICLAFIQCRTGPGVVRLRTNAPVQVRCGHLNAQYTHVECRSLAL